jgi:Protein O-mannosyl-transferase TMEM260-like
MTHATVAGDDPIRTRLLPALVVGFVALAIAWVTLLPGLAFWDTGELQAVAPLMGTAHPTGFPTYILLGWLASVLLQPFGEPAFRMNLFSAICLAVAAGVTVDLVRKLTGWTILGMVAGIGLALTPIVWAVATHAEAHSLHLALLAILLWLLVTWDERVAVAREGQRDDRGDRYLVAAAIVFGLAVGNHSLTLLLAVPVGLYVLAVDPRIWRRGRLVLGCVAVLALTIVLVYLELPLRAGPFRAALVYGTPNTLDGFRYIVLAEQFQGSLSDPFGELPRKAGELVTRAIAQFGILAPLIPVGFVVTALRRPRYALLTGSAVAITCFFNASYVNADINRYYLGPILIAWTWLAILAAVAIELLASAAGEPPLADLGDEAADADPSVHDVEVDPGWAIPGPRASAIAILISLALLVPTVIAAPARYAAVDQSGQHAAQTWVDRALGEMEPDSVIVSWWSYSTPLWYEQRVLGKRPDITIIDDRTRLDENLGDLTDAIDANLGTRPVYVLRLDPREVRQLAELYDLQYIDGADATSLTKVIARKAT